MFGYLNLNDATKIGNNEAQEAVNVKVDKGYLELNDDLIIDETINRKAQDINGNELFISAEPLTTLATNIPAAIPTKGYLKRKINGKIDIVGTPTIYSAGTPASIAAAAYGSQVYPPGNYQYIITAYNPETQEESGAWQYNVTIGVNEIAEFTNFPGFNSSPIFASKTLVEWRIYRRPIGGSEFLRILSGTTLPAFTPLAGPVQDITPDASLGIANKTLETGALTPDYFNDDRLFSVIAVHGNRLWFKQDAKDPLSPGPENAGSVIFYSEINTFGEVGEDSYFGFSSEVVALHSVDEALVVLCKEDVFVIYGNDDTDFVVKQVTGNKVGCVGGFSSAVVGKSLFFLGSNKDDRTKADGVYAYAGGTIQRISFPVDTLFPFSAFSGSPVLYGAGSVGDRFFVVRGKVVNSSENGLLVFDTAANGFLTAEDDTTIPPTVFYYRSKEFGSPGKWDNMRRAFVRGNGSFAVELYYDGVKVDEITFTLTGTQPETEDFTVPPFRSNYFSFRIIGQAGAKVYEFGRLE